MSTGQAPKEAQHAVLRVVQHGTDAPTTTISKSNQEDTIIYGDIKAPLKTMGQLWAVYDCFKFPQDQALGDHAELISKIADTESERYLVTWNTAVVDIHLATNTPQDREDAKSFGEKYVAKMVKCTM